MNEKPYQTVSLLISWIAYVAIGRLLLQSERLNLTVQGLSVPKMLSLFMINLVYFTLVNKEFYEDCTGLLRWLIFIVNIILSINTDELDWPHTISMGYIDSIGY